MAFPQSPTKLVNIEMGGRKGAKRHRIAVHKESAHTVVDRSNPETIEEVKEPIAVSVSKQNGTGVRDTQCYVSRLSTNLLRVLFTYLSFMDFVSLALTSWQFANFLGDRYVPYSLNFYGEFQKEDLR